METGTEVVPVEVVTRSSLVTLAAPINDIVAAQQAHHDICKQLLDDDDYQSIGAKSFRKKSGWRKLAMAYAVSHEILSKEYWYDDEGHITRAEFVVRATAPNGRYEDGIGLCDLSERNFGLKQDHDIPATAHTRAVNRASSDLFGLGEVSAEEVDGGAGTYVASTPRRQPTKAKDTTPTERGNLAPPPKSDGRDTGPMKRRIAVVCERLGFDEMDAIEDALGVRIAVDDLTFDQCKAVNNYLTQEDEKQQ